MALDLACSTCASVAPHDVARGNAPAASSHSLRSRGRGLPGDRGGDHGVLGFGAGVVLVTVAEDAATAEVLRHPAHGPLEDRADLARLQVGELRFRASRCRRCRDHLRGPYGRTSKEDGQKPQAAQSMPFCVDPA